jgi:hypothetical protein
MINKKIIFALSLLASTAVIKPQNTSALSGLFSQASFNTLAAGTAVGVFTGGALGYLSGTIIDYIINTPATIACSIIEKNIPFEYCASFNAATTSPSTKKWLSALKTLVKIGSQVRWGIPLSKKLAVWTAEMLDKHNIPYQKNQLLNIVTQITGLATCMAV